MSSRSKAIERVKSEYAAQKARSAALKYLSDTGAGPSTKEIARDEMQRQIYKNQTTTKVHTYLNRNTQILNSKTTNPLDDPTRVRDNTLQVLAQRNTMNHGLKHSETKENGAIQISNTSVSTMTTLPKGWKKVLDPSSGDYYYWNEMTNETTWDQPIEASGWEMVTDPSSGEKYYWNRDTNETSWTPPNETLKEPLDTNETKETHKVTIESARAAKQRMDKILESCGILNNSNISIPTSDTTRAEVADTKRKGEEFDDSDEKSQKKRKKAENY